MYILRFDGLFKQIQAGKRTTNKAGFMCYGWLIFKNGVLVARGHGAFVNSCQASSNTAEYLALIEGLEALRDMGVRSDPVVVIGDAKSVIDQMTGEAAVSTATTRELNRKARRLVREFQQLTWRWMPRQFNRAADRLTRRAMDQLRSDPQEFQAALEAIQPRGARRAASRGMLPVLDFRVYQPAGLVS